MADFVPCDCFLQKANQSVSQSIRPSVSKSVYPLANQSVSPSVRPSISQSVRPTLRYSIIPSVSQSISQSVRSSIRPSVNQSLVPILSLSSPDNILQEKPCAKSLPYYVSHNFNWHFTVSDHIIWNRKPVWQQTVTIFAAVTHGTTIAWQLRQRWQWELAASDLTFFFFFTFGLVAIPAGDDSGATAVS